MKTIVSFVGYTVSSTKLFAFINIFNPVLKLQEQECVYKNHMHVQTLKIIRVV